VDGNLDPEDMGVMRALAEGTDLGKVSYHHPHVQRRQVDHATVGLSEFAGRAVMSPEELMTQREDTCALESSFHMSIADLREALTTRRRGFEVVDLSHDFVETERGVEDGGHFLSSGDRHTLESVNEMIRAHGPTPRSRKERRKHVRKGGRAWHQRHTNAAH
jgi:hypothetical protein